MYGRLAGALIALLQSEVEPGKPAWIMVEGVDVDLADELHRRWPTDEALPRLRVSARPEADFGPATLRGEPATFFRNQGGICLILCEGQRIADYQSVRGFERYSPADLLQSEARVDLLAAQEPRAPKWPVNVLKQALFDDKLAARPTVRAVARFFDAIAQDANVGEHLPLLGGFRDSTGDGFKAQRLIENLNLAATRSSPEILRPGSLAEIRNRALRHLGGNGDPGADQVVQMLSNGTDALLSALTFERAKAVLEEPPPSELPDAVRAELRRFGGALESDEDAVAVGRYVQLADDLVDSTKSKALARDLLEYDARNDEQVLTQPTRRRVQALLRERRVTTAAIEEGLIRAIAGLPSAVRAIELKDPDAPPEPSTEAQAKAVLALAAVHLRLAPLLRELQRRDVAVDGDLLLDRGKAVSAALAIIDQPGPRASRPVTLVLRGEERGHAVELMWTPDVEDIALLACTAVFAFEGPGISLRSGGGQQGGGLSLAMLAVSPSTSDASALADQMKQAARAVLEEGYEPRVLEKWASDWARAVGRARDSGVAVANVVDELAVAGAVVFEGGDELALTHLAPLKAEWLAKRTKAWLELLDWTLTGRRAEGDDLAPPILDAARALASATSAQYPAFITTTDRVRPLLPSADGRAFSVFGETRAAADVAPPSTQPLEIAIGKLIGLYPEAAAHLRCVAWQDAAADLVLRTLLASLRGSSRIARAEIFFVDGAPAPETLEALDDFARGDNAGRIAVRYARSFDDFAAFRTAAAAPVAHLAVAAALTDDGRRLQIEPAELPMPGEDEDVLFLPKTWVRPNKERRIVLAPPAGSPVTHAWLRLMTAIDDAWPDAPGEIVRVPEIRTDPGGLRREMIELHELALWVVTIDRYASRDSLEAALGDEVAILHQERRLTATSPEGLVISQKSGGAADRAIARQLRASGLANEADAPGLAEGLRKGASRGYGALALRAATTGSGINELIGQVCAFARLGSEATPWPLPPGLRVLLLSLDEYADWFGRGRRADLLALAIAPDEGGVYLANLEVKAVKTATGATEAIGEAKEQLRQTLTDSRFAIRPDGSLFSRLWLNRIAEAAVAISRENRFRLGEDDLAAIDAFRRGRGTLDWAALGVVFRPGAPEPTNRAHHRLKGDLLTMAINATPLTEEILRTAADVDPAHLRTMETGRFQLAASTKERRRAIPSPSPSPGTGAARDPSPAEALEPPAHEVPTRNTDEHSAGDGGRRGLVAGQRLEEREPAELEAERQRASHPILGWDWHSGEPVEWRVVGEGALSNGHVEIYGTSGAGKTQFVKSLLAQLRGMGSHFGVCDFKNDYGDAFPARTSAKFYDLWLDGLPYNPLAIDDTSRRAVQGLMIELRDTVDIAARSFTRLGHRQLHKLQSAFETAFEEARRDGRFPTLADVHELLDDDLRGVIGDLTGTGLFADGPPIGTLVDADAIFGLNHIPGTGLTTTLAAGFILASLYLKLLELPQVYNRVDYTLVIDEAHRVASFHSVGTMVRELRSKGLAVVLATQKPGDLPGEAGTNAQTKIYMRLPDAASAEAAARNLDPGDRGLAKTIRSLGDGEAFVALAGGAPRLLRLGQFWRDHAGA